PFRGDNVLETLRQVVEQEPVRPRVLNPRVPHDLETVCLKCLEKDPARRYQSAQALAEDLDRWLHGEPIRARRAGGAGRVVRGAGRPPAAAGLSAAVALVTVAGLVAFAWQYDQTVRALDDAHKAWGSEKDQKDRANEAAEVARKAEEAAKEAAEQERQARNKADLEAAAKKRQARPAETAAY